MRCRIPFPEEIAEATRGRHEIKMGWSVRIRRDNGSTFMACSGMGDTTPVWCKANRKHAVERKKELVGHGFKAKVVPVEYMEPVVVELSKTKKG